MYRRLLATVSVALAGTSIACASALAAPRTPPPVRIGVAPRLPAGASLVAGIASVGTMRVTVALKPRSSRALQAYAEAVGDPSSPDYRRYLSARQFVSRFAPTRAEVAAVERSLRAHGLTPGPPAANRLSIPIQATGPAIEHAFSVSLASFRLADGADVVLNGSPPAVDARIAGAVQSVIGLDGLQHWISPLQRPPAVGPHRTQRHGASALSASGPTARARTRVDTGGPQPCRAASAAAPRQSAYTIDQIASAYGFPGLYAGADRGSGQTIAVYELEPDAPSDIAAYQSCYGTDVPISYVPVDGGSGTGAGSGEAALDIEQLIGLAPGVRLLVYQGPNSNSDNPGSGPYDTFASIISQDRASVVSNSWGECEPIEGATDAAAENVLFEEAAAQGETVVSAAGDEGAQDCYDGSGQGNASLAVDDPASQPFVTGVGGTTLTRLGPRPSETVWDGALTGTFGSGRGAGGGGVSTLWPMPAYQQDAPPALNVIEPVGQAQCQISGGYCREVPDVSADADPATGYLIYYNGANTVKRYPVGWQGTGGTSGASPVWAALFALADAQPACARAPVGFANPALYAAATESEDSYFNDVTEGTNDLLNDAGTTYSAGPGYDMASGLGTPNAAALAPALCSLGLRVLDPGAQRATRDSPTALQIRTLGAAGSLQFSARGLPDGLAIDPSTGVISGIPKRIGVFTVAVSVGEGTAAVGGAVFGWTVQGRPAISAVSLRQVSRGRPVLALTIVAGKDAPKLHRLVLTLPDNLRLARHLRAVSVASRANRALAHRISGAHGRLTVTLRVPATQIRLVLGAGSVVPRGSLITSVRRGHRATIGLGLETIDEAGEQTVLALAVRPLR